jgi:hypothetical protein
MVQNKHANKEAGMSICVVCEKQIPRIIWIEGKKRYSSNHRKYCFTCSPFGGHNTKRFLGKTKIKDGKTEYLERECPRCGKKHNKRGFVCQCCSFKIKLSKTQKRVEGIVGGSCWICGYDKVKRSLCFHHVNKEDKVFGLTIREIQGYSWSRVEAEMRKCVFVCLNCHGEIHDGLIHKNEIEVIWKNRWGLVPIIG